MKENVSGCFFLNTVYVFGFCIYTELTTAINAVKRSCSHQHSDTLELADFISSQYNLDNV